MARWCGIPACTRHLPPLRAAHHRGCHHQRNADPDVARDIEMAWTGWCPRRGYRHAEGNSDSHVKSRWSVLATVFMAGGQLDWAAGRDFLLRIRWSARAHPADQIVPDEQAAETSCPWVSTFRCRSARPSAPTVIFTPVLRRRLVRAIRSAVARNSRARALYRAADCCEACRRRRGRGHDLLGRRHSEPARSRRSGANSRCGARSFLTAKRSDAGSRSGDDYSGQGRGLAGSGHQSHQPGRAVVSRCRTCRRRAHASPRGYLQRLRMPARRQDSPISAWT